MLKRPEVGVMLERDGDLLAEVVRDARSRRERIPEPAGVAALLPLIGFEKIGWQFPHITLPAGMEIDLGGIGKEYAVDRVLTLIAARFAGAALVNFGEDLAANRAPRAGPWQVGVERAPIPSARRVYYWILAAAALRPAGIRIVSCCATRCGTDTFWIQGRGWPVRDTPRSVTVAAASCVEAGMLAIFAMLQGAGAEAFLEEQGVRFWCLR